MSTLRMPDGWDLETTNHWLAYHADITKAMVTQRTSLESRLVPVTAYVLVAAVECYRRHPEMLLAIERVMGAGAIGAAGRRPGTQVDSVHLWSQANIFLHGRQILMLLGRITPGHEPERTAIVLDFWKRAAGAFRGDGHLQSWDADLVCHRYDDEVVAQLTDGTEPVRAGDAWHAAKRLNALLTSYLFLLYFDTRSGINDHGPYELPDGRTLLIRDFSKMGPSDFPWSVEVAAGLPYSDLTAAFVLDGVRVGTNDWGTSITDPADYLDHTVRFGLFTTDGGGLRRVDLDEVPAIHTATRQSQRDLYRLVAGMSRTERIDAGAYVYFTFLRPFAEVAGVADDLDWTVPRDSGDVYEMLVPIEGSQTQPDPSMPYYWPLHEGTP